MASESGVMAAARSRAAPPCPPNRPLDSAPRRRLPTIAATAKRGSVPQGARGAALSSAGRDRVDRLADHRAATKTGSKTGGAAGGIGRPAPKRARSRIELAGSRWFEKRSRNTSAKQHRTRARRAELGGSGFGGALNAAQRPWFGGRAAVAWARKFLLDHAVPRDLGLADVEVAGRPTNAASFSG